jgi:hypothetical protein
VEPAIQSRNSVCELSLSTHYDRCLLKAAT